MPIKRHSAEQIVRKLREAEVELARGATIKDACRKLAISEHTYYRMLACHGTGCSAPSNEFEMGVPLLTFIIMDPPAACNAVS